MLQRVITVAPTDTSVLVLGQSGTGKEKVVHSINQHSTRHAKPFIIVNCAALPCYLIESELFGQEGGAFTGSDDKRIGKFEMAEGRFRIDLYYRLNVFPILIPPLKDRKEDILLLANHFIAHFSGMSGKQISGLTDHALMMLMDYHWPGNIRELENLIERSVLLCQGSRIDDIGFAATH